MYTKTTIVALFASIAAAQIHAPVGEPKGNAILKPLNEIVPKCEPFTITWEPTTPNTVSVLLLKGPSTNVVKFGPSLAEGIKNSGSLSWTPAKDLEVTEGNTGYGLQIIDDVTGQYQYSTQFGIAKGKCEEKPAESSAAAPAKSSAPAPAMSSAPAGYAAPAESKPVEASSEAPAYHVPQPSSKVAYTAVAPYPTTVAVHPSADMPMGSATGVAWSTGAPQPTGAMTPPNNVTTFTGAASSVKGGLTFAGALAAFALMF